MQRQLVYTRGESSVLSPMQRQFYEENGYILLKNNVDHKLLDECGERFRDICNGRVSEHGASIIMKDPSLKSKNVKGEFLINKVQDFLYDEVLWKYCCANPVVDVIESIIGPNITAVHSMLINKPPDADPGASLHPLHQDLHYFPFRPADTIAASWTAMERVDEQNGCLYVVPGTHKWRKLFKHEYPKGYKNKLYHGIYELDDSKLQKVHVIMEKGDTVFFHPLILHGSGPNLTKGFRKAISCHYADSNSRFIDVRGTSQEEIAKEIENLAAKMTYGKVDFVTVWKAKSRLVRGPLGNFQNFGSHL